jgi:hypothetical protein
MGKIKIRIWESIFGVKMLKFFNADPGSGIFLTVDPGWKNSDPGFGINIPDPQHCLNYIFALVDDRMIESSCRPGPTWLREEKRFRRPTISIR